MLITIPDDIINKCYKFAGAYDQTTDYASRGQKSPTKRVEDAITGKMAEFAVYEFLKSKFKVVSKPCLRVYNWGDKTYSPDLIADGIKIQVKAQDLQSIHLWEMSWVMEERSINKHYDQVFVLCVRIDFNKIMIVSVVPFKELLKIRSKPKKDNLHTKIAFYYKDLLTSKLNEQSEHLLWE